MYLRSGRSFLETASVKQMANLSWLSHLINNFQMLFKKAVSEETNPAWGVRRKPSGVHCRLPKSSAVIWAGH
jgi:hypothetical protein